MVLESSSRQVRIVVDVARKTDRLVLGDKTNPVLYPARVKVVDK